MMKGNMSIHMDDVKAARAASGLTQAAAARLIYNSIDNWQNWEQGRYPMTPGHYELFLLKTRQLTVGESFENAHMVRAKASAEFGRRIFMMRKSRNLTQSALAQLIGSTKQCVCNWEAGRSRAPRAATLARLCKVFEVSVEYILDGVE
jgi:DNA-binding transcriptional regulator YiaG